MEPARHQRRSGSMPRVWAMAVAILALSACTPIVGSSQVSPTTSTPSTKVHLATLGTPRCQPGAFRVSETGFPEVGSDSSRGSFWALFFTPVPPPNAWCRQGSRTLSRVRKRGDKTAFGELLRSSIRVSTSHVTCRPGAEPGPGKRSQFLSGLFPVARPSSPGPARTPAGRPKKPPMP
jgi:hypothetical protein